MTTSTSEPPGETGSTTEGGRRPTNISRIDHRRFGKRPVPIAGKLGQSVIIGDKVVIVQPHNAEPRRPDLVGKTGHVVGFDGKRLPLIQIERTNTLVRGTEVWWIKAT